MIGLIYMGSGKELKNLTNTLGAMFFYVNVATVPLLGAIVPLITERAIFYREVVSGTYSRYAYGLAVQLAELPFNLGAAVVSWAIFYWMVGLDPAADRVVYFILMALVTYWLMPLLGQLGKYESNHAMKSQNTHYSVLHTNLSCLVEFFFSKLLS